jgi:MFS family permease
MLPIEKELSTRLQLLCAWSGPVMMGIFGIGMALLAGFLPPFSPALSAAEISELFRENHTTILLGLMICMFSGTLLGSFITVITVQMRRIEGRHSLLSYLQLAMGAILVLELIYPMIILEVAAFRVDRAPESVLLLHDLGWLILLSFPSTAMLQLIAIGIAILRDPREQTLFPRWSGYFNLWTALLFAPGGLTVFFKTGPLAWDGIFIFWVPFAVFAAWFVLMAFLLDRAIRQEVKEEEQRRAGQAVESDVFDHPRLRLLSAQLAEVRAEIDRIGKQG